MIVTSTSIYRTLQYQLERTSSDLNELYVKSSTGKEIEKASDDPAAVADILGTRSEIEAGQRYIENCETVQDQLSISETYLDSVETLLVRAKEIAISGANSSLSQDDLDSLADEVFQLQDQLLDLANAQVNGKYLFAGYDDENVPFSGTPVAYNGTNDQIRVEVSPGVTIPATIPGDTLFMSPINLFDSLQVLEADLRAGDVSALSHQLDTLEGAANQIRTERSTLGQNSARLDDLMALQEKIVLDQQEALSSWEDADLTEVLSNISKAELALEATMQVSARVTRLRLMDYL